MIFLQLFYEFFKAGLFAIGGGLATLPFLKQISLRYPWFTPNDLMDMIAVSESTPGPMGVNSATYAGFHAAGIPGAITATCSLVLPSVIIIILVSRALDKFRDSPLVKNGFYGLRPASAGLIFGAMLEVFAASLLHTENWSGIASLGSVINVPAIIIFLVLSLGIWKLKKLHPIVFILIGAVCGIVCRFSVERRDETSRRCPPNCTKKSLSQSRKGFSFYFVRYSSINSHASSMQPGQERRTLPSATPLRSRHRYAPFFCSNFSLSIFVTL